MARDYQVQKKRDLLAACAWVQLAEPGTPDHDEALGNLADIAHRYGDDMRYTAGKVLLAEVRSRQQRRTRR